MSNIIKSNHVYINPDDTKIINTNDKLNHLFLVNCHSEKSSAEDEYAVADSVFQEGLNAVVIDQVNEEYNEIVQAEINTQCEAILENARLEAEQIIAQAKLDSQRTIDYLYEEAKKKGYEDGILKATSEIEAVKKQYELKEQKLQVEYLEEIANLEPEFCSILIDLLEKITGIMIEDKKDIISYLVHNAILHADNSKTFIIRTSKEDYEIVNEKKEELYKIISGDSISIEIVVDKELNKNQCLIETDSRIIDCSLDVQLSGLIEDLKLLSIKSNNYVFTI